MASVGVHFTRRVAWLFVLWTVATSAAVNCQQRIVDPDPSRVNGSLQEIALDGDTLVLAAPYWNTREAPPFRSDGRIYIYRWENGAWTRSATLEANVLQAYFGSSMSLNNDLLAVTYLPNDDELALPLLLYSRNMGGPDQWGLAKSILPEEGAVGFTKVALGDEIMALAFKINDECQISIRGKNQGGTNNWGEIRRLRPYQGWYTSCTSFRLRLDQDTLALGYLSQANSIGEVKIYEKNFPEPYAWGLTQTLAAPSGVWGFGAYLDLEGHTLAVTGRVNSVADSLGRLAIYERSPVGGLDSWSSVAQIEDPDPGQLAFPRRPTAISGDRIWLGSTNRGTVLCNALGEGEAFLFQRDLGGTDSWGLLAAIAHPEPGTGCQDPYFPSDTDFGGAVTADGEAWAALDPLYSIDLSGTLYTVGAVWAFGYPGNLQVLDVHPDLIVGGSVTTNTEILATGGVPVATAAADGATRLLLRAIAPAPGSVEFSIVGPVLENGGIDVVGGTQRLQSVTTTIVNTLQGLRAFASYRVPDEFNRGADELATSRDIDIQAVISPSSGPQIVTRFTIHLVRPPLVLVHGLWSNSTTWTSPASSDPRIPVIEKADYRGTNAAHFAENISVVQRATAKALSRARLKGIACTQVIVAAHSMGGVLTRLWANDPNYYRSDNFGLGEIRKFITLDTPHLGSPVADLMVELRSRPVTGVLLALLLERIGNSIVDGAIDDLRAGSQALSDLGACSIPAHGLVGIGGSDVLAQIPGHLGAFYTIVNFFESITGNELFQSLQHDALVPRPSEEGGIDASATTVFGGWDGVHTSNTGSALYSERILDLIDTPIGSSEFGLFPAPLLASRVPKLIAPKSANIPNSSNVIIVSPAPGTVVSPGEVVAVEVVPSAGATVDRVLLVGPASAQIDDSAPFEFSLTIPAEAIGATSIVAVGANTEGDYAQSAEVALTCEVASPLVSIRVEPEFPVLLWSHDTIQLSTIGLYSDGVSREITSSQLGTQYLSANPGIATVTSEGFVRGLNLGTVAISVQNGAIAKEVLVVVADDWAQIFADGFETGSTANWSDTTP